jgi:hypothetical protein
MPCQHRGVVQRGHLIARLAAGLVIAAAAGVLFARAADADADAFASRPSLTAMDLVVGAGFLAAR